MRFTGLNEQEDVEQADIEGIEKQEACLKEAYTLALSQLQRDESERAREGFCQILRSLSDADNPCSIEITRTLSFLACKHIGTIDKSCGDVEGSVTWLLQASQHDPTDSLVWYQLGDSAERCAKLPIARVAYEQVHPTHRRPHTHIGHSHARLLDVHITAHGSHAAIMSDSLPCVGRRSHSTIGTGPQWPVLPASSTRRPTFVRATTS